MTEIILSLVPVYGTLLVFGAVTLGCVGIPAPATVSLIVGGAFVARGDLALEAVLAAGVAGAMIGDHLGYWAGTRGSRWAERLEARPGAAGTMARARAFTHRWGGMAVFLSRWLVSPLGPPVNVASGMLGMSWQRFTLYGLPGKLIWVGLFTGLGYLSGRHLAAVIELSGTVVSALALMALAAGAAFGLRRLAASRAARRDQG